MNSLLPIRRLVSHSSIPVDLAIEVPHLPERGGDVLAKRSGRSAGGGFNVISAAARLGLPAVYAGPHGTGPFGDIVRAALAAEGMVWLQPANAAFDTGYTVVLVEGGERTMITVPGADGVAAPELLATVSYQEGDAVFLSGYDLAYPAAGATVAEHVAGLADALLLAFDPGPLVGEIAPARLAAVLERADLVTLNLREAELLGGADALLSRLRRPRVVVILRAGAGGATILRSGAQPLPVPAVPTRVVDSTGAGDVHAGALLAGLARGLQPPEAVLLANRAAAYAVSQRGAATGPTQIQLDQFGAGRW